MESLQGGRLVAGVWEERGSWFRGDSCRGGQKRALLLDTVPSHQLVAPALLSPDTWIFNVP